MSSNTQRPKGYNKENHLDPLQVNNMECPLCDGRLISEKVPYSFKGIYFGVFDAYVCNKCKESFMREKHLQPIEIFAKKKGVWGHMEPIDNSIKSPSQNLYI